ncbi:amino acid adenylation domain-containing protein [Microbispora sp. NPDC046933]|uniref:amino acid adenylation domain-containing protein n=1 Tax=Microbispora sp. NPDC046933 TaxID=3155618 RepID=UPI003401C91A
MRSDAATWNDTGRRFSVVRSDAGHLSVWPVERPLPPGWRPAGREGDYEGCIAAVEATGDAWPGPQCAGRATCPHDTLTAIVGETVRLHGDRGAVTDADRALTYRDLDRESGRMAAALRRSGVSREDRVAVYLPRGADVFVALLAILKAGGAYVPVDTRYPDARRDLMIRDSGARLVITSSRLLPGLASAGVTAVTVEELTERLTGQDDAPLTGDDVLGCQAACVLFTSGSSGVPKAIVLEHRNLGYFALNSALPRLVPEDRVGHVSSLSFDAFNFEVWCTLAAGAEIVVLPTMPDLVATDLQRELRRQRVTAMLAPTMAVNHVVHEDREAFSSLRILHTGGDVILPSACRELLSGSFAGAFHNLYGPTEGTTACTAYHIEAVGPDEVNVPIGVPLTGAGVYLLDGDRRPVVDGQVGEIFIGGPGVARGYLGQPGLTASRFLPDPFAPDCGRMYATGDLARRRDDGLLEFVGRVDDQVKVRGYRVEPREVERLLSRYPGVRDLAVVVSGEGDGKHLVALVAGEALSLRDLRDHAAEVLPDYMVPGAFALVREIPANDHGKRDTGRLLRMARDELRRRSTAVPPRNEVEHYLAKVWEDLLGVEEVGVHDDFFALGGNSMLSFRLRRRIGGDLGVSLDMHDVLTVTVLGELADLVTARRCGAS